MTTPRRTPKRAKQLGVSDDEYARLLEAQGGHCALCPNQPKSRRLHVDHDHRTGRVRGLLCHSCNRRLWTGATAEWLTRAAGYVEPGATVFYASTYDADEMRASWRTPAGGYVKMPQRETP